MYLSLFFRYLIRFEHERKVTTGFLCWLFDYFLYSIRIFPASSLNFYMLGEPWNPMYYGLVLDSPLG